MVSTLPVIESIFDRGLHAVGDVDLIPVAPVATKLIGVP